SVATALLRAGDYEGLARAVQAMGPDFEKADIEGRRWYGWIKDLAEELTTPPDPHRKAGSFLTNTLVSLEAHQLSVEALHRAGRLEAARDLLVISRQLYPESQRLRNEQSAVMGELAAKEAAVV